MANNPSSLRINIAFGLNILVMLLGFVFAFRYIMSPELTAYHLNAMGLDDWSSVAPAFKPMLTVFKRVAGIGMSTASVAMGIILFVGFRKREAWSRWAFLIICLVHYLPLLANQFYLETHTNTASPYLITIIAVSIAMIAFFLSWGMGAEKTKQ